MFERFFQTIPDGETYLHPRRRRAAGAAAHWGRRRKTSFCFLHRAKTQLTVENPVLARFRGLLQKLFTFSTVFSTANTKTLRVFPHGFPHFPPSFPHLRGKPCYTCRNQNQIFPANFGAFPCLFAFFIKSCPAFSVLFSGAEKSFSREEFFSPKFSTPGRFSTPGTAGALFHTFVKNRLWKSPFSHREQRSKTIRFCVISPQKTALLWGAVPGQRRAAVAMQSQRDAAGGKRPVCPPANAKDPLSFAHFYIILWKISIAIWK